MSFGAFSLFNFYQQPNTGKQPVHLDTGILISGNQMSGAVADFNWYFPYGGTMILYGLIESQSRFGFHIWADSYGASDIEGLHYATISTAFYGSLSSINEYVYFGDKFYGTVYPQMNESLFQRSSFSGILSGAENDSVNYKTIYSGRLSGQKSDTFSCGVNFSGNISANGEVMYVNVDISGIINQQPKDYVTCAHQISGSFWPLYSDLCQISFLFTGFSIGNGLSVVPSSSNDNENISFTLVGYQISS